MKDRYGNDWSTMTGDYVIQAVDSGANVAGWMFDFMNGLSGPPGADTLEEMKIKAAVIGLRVGTKRRKTRSYAFPVNVEREFRCLYRESDIRRLCAWRYLDGGKNVWFIQDSAGKPNVCNRGSMTRTELDEALSDMGLRLGRRTKTKRGSRAFYELEDAKPL